MLRKKTFFLLTATAAAAEPFRRGDSVGGSLSSIVDDGFVLLPPSVSAGDSRGLRAIAAAGALRAVGEMGIPG